MAMQQNQPKATSTQIRNLYSENVSYMRITFFGMNLSFAFQRFLNRDQSGKQIYDTQNAIVTTVNWNSAFMLHNVASGIIEGKYEEAKVELQCAADTMMVLEKNATGTTLTVTKNGNSIPFKFETKSFQVKENGQVQTKVVEAGLGTLVKTINGYLEGINADRHLDKMTEDYVKSLGDKANQGNFQTNSGYQNKGGYNNNYKGGNNYNRNNNNNGYRRPYNNNYNNNQGQQQPQQNNSGTQSWESQSPNQQNMSNYSVQK